MGLSACNSQNASLFSDQHRAKAEEAFNNGDMITSLEQILLWHQSNRTDIPAALNLAHSRATILEAFADGPCQPTDELLQLWTWHNGTKEVITPFIWYHNFLSVEEAKLAQERLTSNPLIDWHPNWIPIFEFEGEWYLVECYIDLRRASPVEHFFLENDEAFYVFLNLTKMLETSAVWFGQPAVTWDNEQQGMEEDSRKVFEIHQMLNEGTQFSYHIE